MEQQKPMAGVGVMIIKDGKVLLGRRKGSHGAGEYAFPGGHLEYMEGFEECVKREAREECGIEITNVRFQFLANLTQYAPKHYVHVGLIADWKEGEPKALEPEYCEGWDWYDFDHIPERLFGTLPMAMECYRTGRCYFDLKKQHS
jgi:8-oxo-dGTP diphosphatase